MFIYYRQKKELLSGKNTNLLANVIKNHSCEIYICNNYMTDYHHEKNKNLKNINNIFVDMLIKYLADKLTDH